MVSNKRTKAVMIDFETLGTRADAAVISLGAVKFDPYSDFIEADGFYRSISIDSNLQAGRSIDESTLIWWMGQSKKARKVFTEQKVTLDTALNDFIDWVGDGSKLEIWSNGASFDIPMLDHSLRTHGADPVFQFWNHRCFRTIKALPQMKNAPKAANMFKHNALMDAHAQALQLQIYFKEMAA